MAKGTRKKARAAKKKSAHKVAKKRGSKKKAAKKKGRRRFGRVPGFKRRGGGLLVPASLDDQADVVEPNLMHKGIAEAKSQMKRLIYDFADNLEDGCNLKQVEFEASFNADGKFLGFGVGGATSIKLTVDLSEVEDDEE